MPTQPRIVYFRDAAALRAWFERHGASAQELIAGFYKKHTGKPSPAWSECVDEALCFGWIDGIRRTVDADRFTNRFTPRRKGSRWSSVNIAKVKALIAAGRMTPAGMAAYATRSASKAARAKYDTRPQDFLPEHAAVFKTHQGAWEWFQAQPPGYRRMAVWFVVSAARPETQARRLQRVIDASAARQRIIGPTPAAAKAPATR